MAFAGLKRKRSFTDEDDTLEMVDNSTTRVLPDEMLSHIFALLPLADRKRVRLTCRAWYHCCTSANITRHEKFVFRTDPGSGHIAQVMLGSSYSILNLEFQRLPVSALPANGWKACGRRIRKLEFYMCELDDETVMSNIILHCENLTSLVITKEEYAGDTELAPTAYSPRLLNDLIDKGIRRPELHTLSVSIEYDGHESVLRKIFLLHPCIKHLNLKMVSQSTEFRDTFAMRLDKCLRPDAQLESLTLTIITPKTWLGALVDQAEQQGVRLTYFETSLTSNEESPNLENKICDFFRSQRDLEFISLWTKITPNNLFYHVLESCPTLREFELATYWSSLDLKPTAVPRFIASISKLERLALCFKLERSEQVPSFRDLLPNTLQLNLTSLMWMNFAGDSDFCAAFLRCCPSLRYLDLENCWDSTLQTIFQYLPELRTLVLSNIDDCTDFGFTGRTGDKEGDGYSIKRLQHLRHLELLITPESELPRPTKRTLLELQLPHLESLCVDVMIGWHAQLSEEELNHFASHLPELRVLAINPAFIEDNFSEDEIPQLCKRLNNLNRLILSAPYWNSSHYQQAAEIIFSACPSLRYISDDDDKTFMRDPFTGKVTLFTGSLKF